MEMFFEMSGGAFDYKQLGILSIIEDLELEIKNNSHMYSSAMLEIMEQAILHFNVAYTYAQNIDLLISADNSEETCMDLLDNQLNDVYDKHIKDGLSKFFLKN